MTNDTPYSEQPPSPNPDLKSLDRLVGTWKVSGGTQGQVRYEWMEGDALTIWGGEKGSPAYYKGMFSADGNTLSGEWVYPGGGGYQSTSVRVK